MISLDNGYAIYKRMDYTATLSSQTWQVYIRRVANFCQFLRRESVSTIEKLEESPEVAAGYAEFLKVDLDLDVNSIRAYVTAAMHFCDALNIKIAQIQLPQMRLDEPITLSDRDESQLMELVAVCSSRQRALILLMLHCGLRSAEILALNVSDLIFSSFPGAILVGDRDQHRRQIPLTGILRSALNDWLLQCCVVQCRASLNPNQPLFVGTKGGRLTIRGLHYIVSEVGALTELRLSNRVLRNTYLAQLARSGVAPEAIGRLGGLRSMNTWTRHIFAANQ